MVQIDKLFVRKAILSKARFRVDLMTCYNRSLVMGEKSRLGVTFALLLLAPGAAAETQFPEVAPQVRSAMPLGVQRGKSAEVLLRGTNLNHALEIHFARKDIAAEILSSEFYEVRVRVEVGAGVPLGIHDYRLRTPRGSHVGVLHVGGLPQQLEEESNGDRLHPQAVPIPVLIDGLVDQADLDFFRFRTQAAETIVISLIGTRAASPLDATLAILDEQGNELDFSDDHYMFKDPELVFTARQAGDYVVRVAGSQTHVYSKPSEGSYRLLIGQVPLMNQVLPAGARRGKTTELELIGLNLNAVSRIVLGDSLAQGEIVEKGALRLKFRMSVPSTLNPGRYLLHAVSGQVESSLLFPIVVSDVDEKRARNGSSRKNPQDVNLPVAVTGDLERPRAADFYAFEVQAGQRLAFEVNSMQLGYMLDPSLFIYDLNGRQIAYQDEPAPNNSKEMPNLDPDLVHEFEKAGRYLVMIRDSGGRGHPDYIYRLQIAPVEPAFEVKALTPSLTLFRGQTNLLPVRVRRLGGWDTPLEVWLENPPPGVQVDKEVGGTKNTTYKGTCGEDLWIDGTNVVLSLQIPASLPRGFYPLRVRSRGMVSGRVIEHPAEILYRWGSVGKITGPTTEQILLATVTDLPRLVLETPRRFSIGVGNSGRLKVVAARFDDLAIALTLEPKSFPAGVTVENNMLASGAHLAELLLNVSEGAMPGTYPVHLQAGKVTSPPIELEISQEEEN